ncbi:hypothetical protein Tco_1413638 [Tanacetum coccineum]
MALPPRNQRHRYLRFEGLQYTDADIMDFEMRLGKIYRREVHRVQVFDFGGLTDLMVEGLSGRMLMEHRDAQGQGVFTSRSWRSLFKIRGLLIHELILEFFSTFRFGEAVLDLDTAGALQFQLGGVRRPSSYTSIRDSMLRLCHRLIAYSIVGRSQEPKKVLKVVRFGEEAGGYDIRSLGTREDAAGAAEDAPVVDEGAPAVPTPVQAPQPPPPMVEPARTMAQRLGRLDEDVHGLRGELGEQREDQESKEISMNIGGEFTNLEDLEVLES